MSFSDAAKESGPIGVNKIPEIPKPEQTTPHGKIEVIPDSKLKEFKSSENHKPDISKIKEFEKDFDDAKHKGHDLLSKIISNLKTRFQVTSKKIYDVGICASQQTSNAAHGTIQELKNPVVLSQTLVVITSVIGGYYAYLERHRIDFNNKLVLGIHGLILTGFVLLDSYLFNKFYPKYK